MRALLTAHLDRVPDVLDLPVDDAEAHHVLAALLLEVGVARQREDLDRGRKRQRERLLQLLLLLLLFCRRIKNIDLNLGLVDRPGICR